MSIGKTSYTVRYRYEKKTYKPYSLRLRYKEDAALIEKLDNVESKNDYIRQLIKRDIEPTK